MKLRRDAPGKSSPLKTLLLLLCLNVVPIGFATTIFILHQQGKVTVKALPQESLGTVALMAVALLGIVALGWVVYPPLRDLRTAAKKRSVGTFGFIFRGLAFFLLLDLAIVGLLVLALAGAELVLLARFALSLQRA